MEYVDIENAAFTTDGHQSYRQMASEGVIKNHKYCVHSTRFYVYPLMPDVYDNNVESFWRVAKVNTLGIRHRVDKDYLQKYIDKSCFRQNHREEKTIDRFDKILEFAVA